MDNPNPIYYKDLVTPDDSITTLINQLGDLIKTYDDAKGKIQGAAAAIAQGMENVASATEDERKQIQLATEQSDKLVKQYRDVTTKQWEATQAFAEAAKAKKESAQIDKLVTQINTSAEGSYNRLSAQYRLNKIRLNELSAEQRATVPEYKALETETRNMYEEMKRLQELTGKHQLNVGNYADAAKGLRTELMSLTNQMAYLKAQGQTNTQEYRDMANRAGQLKDAMMDARSEVNNMASDTQQLDTTMGATSAASGGMAAVAGTLNLIGVNSETASDAQKNLGTTIGIVSGLTAVQNALQKESALMTGIRVLQTKALTKAQNLQTASTKANTVAIKGATVAQRIFNAVAAANPYVLLAMALITVVGALLAFAAGSDKSAKEQSKLNGQIAAGLDYMEEYTKSVTRANNERAAALQRELDIAKARNASVAEQQKIEDAIYNERVAAHDKQMKIYADEIANEDIYRQKLDTLRKTLYELQKAQAAGKNKLSVDVDLDGHVERVHIDKAIDAVQGQIDNYGRAVEISTTLRTEGADIAKERAVELAQRRQAAQQAAKTETDILRKSNDVRIALIKDSYTRERITQKLAAQRQIEDIQTRLKTESNLTKKARKALNDQIKAIEIKLQRDLVDIQNKYSALNTAVMRETEDIQIALMAEGAEKQREQLRVSYQRQMNDITTALANERDLTVKQREEMYKQYLLLADQYAKEMGELNAQIAIDQMNRDADAIQLRLDAVREGSQEEIDLQIELLKKQRDIELAENAQMAADVRQSEADINRKWDAIILRQTTEMTQQRGLMLLDMQQELAASEFDLLNKNERQKTQFQLQMERERLQKILELNKTAGVKLTAEQVATIQNQIAAIDKVSKKTPFNNLYEVLGIGLDDDQQSALNEAIGTTVEAINGVIDAWLQEAEAAVTAANARVEAAQRALDAEIEARNNGYANNVVQAQKELELEKQQQQKAIEEKQKAQKAQLAIDTITQASSLITASANIWSSLSGIPVVGVGLAVAALATMWGSFLASKAKAAQVTKESYGDGTVELLQGGSHASGNDIDLGMTKDGKNRRAEGGEYFAIINKRNSRRFGSIIPDVINSFNDGTFADKYQRANSDMAGVALAMVGSNGTDVSALERGVDAIRKQGERTRFVDGDGNTIEIYKNVTRKILKS